MHPAHAPLRLGRRLLDRLALLDSSESARSRGAVRLRRSLAMGAALTGIVLSVKSVADGGTPGPGHVIMLLVAVTLYTNHFGRFLRDWSPVAVLVAAYVIAFGLVEQFSLRIWYWPQIHADEVIGLGTLPTYRLQEWLGAADNHPLAVISALAYLSHFLVPPLIGFYLWWHRDGRGFGVYMYSLIVVNLLASVPWVLTPTAPPWLAAEQGLIAAPVDVIRMGLQDMGLTQLVAFKDSNTYLIAAAVPSIHAAWPFLGVLVARSQHLPRWLGATIMAQLVVVWFVIVYAGEHYVVDIAVGVAFSLAAWWIVQRIAARPRSDTGAAGHSDGGSVPAPDVIVVRVPVHEDETVQKRLG